MTLDEKHHAADDAIPHVRRVRRAGVLLGMALLAMAAPLSLCAGQMIPLPIKTLAGQSQLIVHASVTRVVCREDERGGIFTEIHMKPIDVWKGDARAATDTLRVIQSGGILGNRAVRVTPQASFQPGETVVAFLARNPSGEWVPFGLAQGKFTVWLDPVSGVSLARNPFHGGAEDHSRNRAAATDPETTSRALSLSDLKRRVRESTE